NTERDVRAATGLTTSQYLENPLSARELAMVSQDGSSTLNQLLESLAATPLPQRPSSLLRFLTSDVLPPGNGSFTINEPSVAQSGKFVFYTGNWYAARSSAGGASWSFFIPWTGMPDFCCDQEVVHDRGRHLFLWYRQGAKRFVLSASSDGGAGWCSYSIRPTFINGAWNTDQSFDFPHLALGNNFLYILTGVKGTNIKPGSTVLFRFPLDMFAGCK